MDNSASAVLIALFVLSGIGSVWTLVRHRRANHGAWLKTTILGWYAVVSFISIVSIGITTAYPDTKRYWTVFFNATAQLISVTGIVDVAQFAYCRNKLRRLADTNVLFMKIYFASEIAVLTVFVGVLLSDIFLSVSLTAYRSFTLLIMAIEAACYCWALFKLLVSKRAAIYYSFNFVSRVGIIFALLARICGLFDSQVVTILHYTFIMLAVVPIAVFSVQPPWKSRRQVDMATTHGVGTTSSHHGGPNPPWARNTVETVPPPKAAARKAPNGEVSITIPTPRAQTEARAQSKSSRPDPNALPAEKRVVDKPPSKSAEKKLVDKQHVKVVEKKAAERTNPRAADKRPAERMCVRAYVNAIEKTCSGRSTSSSEIMRVAKTSPTVPTAATAASSARFGEAVPEMSDQFFEELRREWFYNSSERSWRPVSVRAFSARPPSEKPRSVRARSSRAPASQREGMTTHGGTAAEQPQAAEQAPRSVRRDVVQTAEL